VGWIDNGDWMEYRVEVAEEGLYLVQYRVAASTIGGIIRMRIREGEQWRTLHMLEFDATGGWQNWTTVSDTLSTGLEVEDAATGLALRAWPNPATEVLYLEAAGLVPVHYQLLSMEGRVFREGEFNGSSQVQLEGCPPGLYILLVQTAGEQKPRHLKVVIGSR